MVKTTQKNLWQKILIILIGGLLLGFLWRLRGSRGWGSEAGVFNVGFVYLLFITTVMGERKKLDLGWLSLTAMSFILTVPSWGTILTQITGVIRESEVEGAEHIFRYISPVSGAFMMCCVGFGVAGLFGVLLGRGFSSHQWKIKDFIVVIGAFLIFDIVSKASISHWIVQLIQPEAVDLFEEGLETAGIEGSAYKVFMQNFADISWSKKIIGGRNYFSEIQAVSSAIRALGAILAARFIVKDKVAAKVGALVCGAFGLSITISDLFFWFTKGGYRQLGIQYEEDFIYAWSCWEYFTGFIAGVIITAFLLSLKQNEDVTEIAFSNLPEKSKKILVFAAGFICTVGVNLVRPVARRFDSSDTVQIIAISAAVVLTAILIALLVKKGGINAEKMGIEWFARILLPIFTMFMLLSYFFVASAEHRAIVEINTLHNILVIISALSVLVYSFMLFKKRSDNNV